MRFGVFAVLFSMSLVASMEAANDIAHFDKKSFRHHWQVASESDEYRLNHLSGKSGDTLEIIAPKGLTLWRRDLMQIGRRDAVTGTLTDRDEVIIEYDACVMLEEGHPEDRLSDLNCFWMAGYMTDGPSGKEEADPWTVSGKFVDSYNLSLYYMGYGGNSNKTTRFRRYNGDQRGVSDAAYRPAILVEYTDSAHLNVANRWRHIKLTASALGRVTYTIDGERLVNHYDANPLLKGYFGFRTTWSRTRITNFTYRIQPEGNAENAICMIGNLTSSDSVALAGQLIPVQFGFVDPPSGDQASSLASRFHKVSGAVRLSPSYDYADIVNARGASVKMKTSGGHRIMESDRCQLHVSESGRNLIDKVVYAGRVVMENIRLHTTYEDSTEEAFELESVTFPQDATKNMGNGHIEFRGGNHIVHLYYTPGAEELRFVHTFVNRRADDAPRIKCMALEAEMPMSEALYNRHVAFSGDDRSVWHEPVQPLTGRRQLPDHLYARQMKGEAVPVVDSLDEKSRSLIRQWASWDTYRLSQLNDMSFTIRKAAKSLDRSPWIGTYAGHRSSGAAFMGDIHKGVIFSIEDFWQSYPSSIYLERATSDRALVKLELWSEEAEPMDLRHYDTEAHGLEAAYEDVQEGLSTAYGIARTSTLRMRLTDGYPGDTVFASLAHIMAEPPQMIMTPQYMHSLRLFGVWSLPDTTAFADIEKGLAEWMDFYKNEIDRRHWYGYWNYGDVMHNYDQVRQEWMYDIGGFAWDNTELASNMMLWYNFLRTGRYDLWRMSVAMSRHTSEVDVYHDGDLRGLGSRHNVTHWGCGAKEARISQSAWNRFYYYLSGGDDRTLEVMAEQIDTDTLLYHLDPMRLAQPRDKYPCTAPARLRIGPDWLAYFGNWYSLLEVSLPEKEGSAQQSLPSGLKPDRLSHVYRKMYNGMSSIARLSHGFFTGPKALGYDPATGEVSYEGDTAMTNTNHLLAIMGGFEIMNEFLENPILMEQSQREDLKTLDAFRGTWLDFCQNYRWRADSISHHSFLIPRLHGYAASHLPEASPSSAHREKAWTELRKNQPRMDRISTNSVAMWCLDAIYLMEVCPR